MAQQKIENYMEYLFSLALQKSGSFSDAEDLSQDVLLAAYAYLRSGGKIGNMKAWLSGTLNHKYYDMLRKKYKMPTISIDLIPEQPVCEDNPIDRPTAEQIRREIAYLSKLYREVIVRHYLWGERTEKIAKDLGIPRGTVLSRLSAGRKQMRKGIEHMEQYEKQSHTPERLEVSCHGCPGLNGEPWSLVAGDMMKQNILIIAYDKPITVIEIARALGIPTPYIEKAVDDLIKSELMGSKGSNVFTDFMITGPEDLLKKLETEIEFTEQNYTSIWNILSSAISELDSLGWVRVLADHKRTILEYYYILHILSSGIYTAISRMVSAKETYPTRPNGGSWIAIGNRYPQDFDFSSYKAGEYCYGGERSVCYENFLGAGSVSLHVYDTQPDLNKYEHAPIEIHDDTLCKLLYIIEKGIPFERSGFDTMFLKDIPHLAECGILDITHEKAEVAIPVITKTEYQEMDGLRVKHMQKLADFFEKPLKAALPSFKIDIPKHLEGRVPEIRQYSCYSIPMAVIKTAIAKGDFLKGIPCPTPPMVLAIEEADSTAS